MAWKKNQKALLKGLSSKDKKKRDQAARNFLKMGEEGAVTLISALESQDEALQKIASQILARLGTKAIPALEIALKRAAFSTKEKVIFILEKIQSPNALALILSALKSDNYKLQIRAANSLGNIKNTETIPHLLVALSDSDPDVRIATLIALGKFREPKTYLNIADLLDDAEINVRMAAAQTLGEIGAPETIPYLVDALHDSFWWYGRSDAIKTLMNVIASFGKVALDPLIEAMHTEDPTVRRYAIALLRPLKERQIIDALEMAFYDTNYDVAESALEALLEFGESILPILDKALNNPSRWIREKAVWGLGEIGGERAIVYLLEILSDETIEVRTEAIRALTKLKDPRTLPKLRALTLKRDEKEIAKLARQAIAAIEAP
ncbi:MAG: HEAT repeat domain-containing protein [Chloroflexi bacterium]|nr:HEAT repeat domain-containing protein [Chloroflexota bacterium]